MSLSLSSRVSLSVGAFADAGEATCNNSHYQLSHTADCIASTQVQLAHAVQHTESVRMMLNTACHSWPQPSLCIALLHAQAQGGTACVAPRILCATFSALKANRQDPVHDDHAKEDPMKDKTKVQVACAGLKRPPGMDSIYCRSRSTTESAISRAYL